MLYTVAIEFVIEAATQVGAEAQAAKARTLLNDSMIKMVMASSGLSVKQVSVGKPTVKP